MTKLTKKKIGWIIRQKEVQESSGENCKGPAHNPKDEWIRLSSQYRDTGTIPIIGQKMGRQKEADHGVFISTKGSDPSTIPCRNIPAWLRWCPAWKRNRRDLICRGIAG